MQSKATTVDAYLKSLPADRRDALTQVRRVILDHLDEGFTEGMQYGMIGYAVPHSIYPQGYHCDPKQPLPFAGLASQKGHMSLYLMCIYGNEAEHDAFVAAWKKTGKKLDMGKSCIRFKKVDDLALDVIANTFKDITAKKYIAGVEAARSSRAIPAKPTKKSTKKAAKKAVTKTAAKKKTKPAR